MSDTHSRIIAAAAKVELGPLGFRQRGRSRLWLADRGSWLNVVEFTPSRWSKSVSLMNAAHWLFAGSGFMSFSYAVPSNRHAEFETEDQFMAAATDIAGEAAAKAREIDDKFSSFSAIADFLVEQAQGSDRMRPSWWGYQAGIASGLRGRFEEAGAFLRGVTDERVTGRAQPLLSLMGMPERFKSKVNNLVAKQRTTLKLPALEDPPF